jgi:metallo-beta-lactamase family protein
LGARYVLLFFIHIKKGLKGDITMGKKDKVKVSFCGMNASEVTGSMTLIEYPIKNGDTKKILIECGIFQSNNIKRDYEINNRRFDFKPKEIDYVIIGHHHGDHFLRIPKLFKEGADCPVIVPKGSYPFMKPMAMDSAFIMARDAQTLTRIRKKETYPIYNEEDAYVMLDHVVEYEIKEIVQLDEYVTLQYIPSGHIENACQIVLWIKKPNGSINKILYTSDLGNPQLEKTFCNKFEPVTNANIVIGEATYNNADRCCTKKDREKDIEKIRSVVESTCIDRNSKVLFAIFSLDRCQHILYELYKMFGKDENFDTPVYIDSPLACKLTKVYKESYDGTEKGKIFDEMCNWKNIKFISDPEDSKMLTSSSEPMIVLSSSAFCTAGRAVKWCQHLLPNRNAHIVFCGYSGSANSIAWKIKNLREQDTIKVDGKVCKNRCSVTSLKSFSSHAQYETLLDYYSSINSEKVCIVHSGEGKLEFCKALKEELEKKNKTTKVVCVNKDTELLI